ncbi:hypothetical protein ASPCAL12976 [Aspergillus calidoustus]|uniref:Uncharacterized protein n=1 Tax=Aspergillus calidoustus TaxID=454130 RepID=A0A0U5GEY8_ASPCI|nr:hypothetical protein ASPCAL12976 [Aspergillus calidoustus]
MAANELYRRISLDTEGYEEILEKAKEIEARFHGSKIVSSSFVLKNRVNFSGAFAFTKLKRQLEKPQSYGTFLKWKGHI